MDDVGSGAAKYLSGFSDVTSLLGSFSLTDPIVGNQGQPYLFNSDLLVDLKGTSAAALVVSDFGGWSAPPMLGSQRFRRLRVDVWQDALRDAEGNVSISTEGMVNLANVVFNAVQRHLHRRDPDTVVWGDLVTFACQLLTEPQFAKVPDGDWGMLGTAYYGVSFSGWTDAVSLFAFRTVGRLGDFVFGLGGEYPRSASCWGDVRARWWGVRTLLGIAPPILCAGRAVL